METLSRLLLGKRAWVLGGIGLITLVLGAFSLQIRPNERPDELLYKDDPEYPRLQAFFQEFGYDEIVVAAYSADNVLAPGELQRIRRITEELGRVDGITHVVSIANALDVFVEEDRIEIDTLLRTLPETEAEQEALKRRLRENPLYEGLLVSRDNRVALFDITLDAELNQAERDSTLERIDSIFHQEGNGHPHYLAGSPIGRSEIFRCMRRDFSTLLPVGMLLLIATMYLVFRNYLCVLLPFIAISLSVVWTVGVMSLVEAELNFFSVLIPTILFIIGTSDCIHILTHYQDCRHTCRTKSEALDRTIRSMALPCLLTTVTTMVGFLSLGACRIAALRAFGVFSALGMAFAYVLSMTILPVGLSLGDTKPLTLRRSPSEALGPLLARIHRFNTAHKGWILPAFLLVFCASLWGLDRLYVETDPGRFFGKKMRIITDMLFIERKMGGFIPFFVVVDGHGEDRIQDPVLLRKIEGLGEFIRQQEGVDQVVSAADLVKYMNYRLNDGDPSEYRIPDDRNAVAELLLMASMSDESDLLPRFFDDAYSQTAVTIRFRHHDFHSFKRLMDAIEPYLDSEFGPDSSVTTYVTGTNMMLARTLLPIMDGLRDSLVLAGIAISCLLILLFRSAWVALISMPPNAIPITMTLGIMGALHISLNFGTVPIAAIALGLAIDDTIHFLSRFRREFSADRNHEAAISRTMQSVGRPILVTSGVLTAGFFIFLLSNFQYTRNMGMLISLTVTTAILGDLILLPALLMFFRPLGRKSTE